MYNVFLDYGIFGLIFTIIIIIVLAFILTNFFVFVINKISNKWNLEITLNYLLKDFSKYATWIIAIFAILEVIGVDVSAIVVSLGIVGISIGFAARDIISSFIAGIFIIADNTVKIGEVIEIGDTRGRVQKLGFRTTTLVTTDNLIVTVPNSLLSKNFYISYTYLDEQRIDLEVSIPYNVDLENFKEIFIEQISTLDWVLEDSKPRIIVKEIISEEIILKISAWANEYSKIEQYRLNLANETRKILNELYKVY
ncbi:MAG: mechanosensitive ion channel family protein [Methanobrevibacter sp.]|nr:mechanosensitive ion channel family protein [Methanobrevibacter sp.]